MRLQKDDLWLLAAVGFLVLGAAMVLLGRATSCMWFVAFTQGWLLGAAWAVGKWLKSRQPRGVCKRCKYPMPETIIRCPECGLGKDGSEPPVEKIIVKDRATP